MTRREAFLDAPVVYAGGPASGCTALLMRHLAGQWRAGVEPRTTAVLVPDWAAGQRWIARLEARLDPPIPGQAAAFVGTPERLARRLLAGVQPRPDVDFDAELSRWRRGFAQRHPGLAREVLTTAPPHALRRAISALARHRDLTAHVGPLCVDWADLRSRLAMIHLELRHQAALNEKADALYARNTSLMTLLTRAFREPTPRSVVRAVLHGGLRGDRRRGRSADWAPGAMERFRQAVGAFQAWRDEADALWQGALHARFVADVQQHLIPLLPAADAAPVHGAIIALREPANLRWARSQVQHIWVDDAEAIDPLAWTLIEQLGGARLISGSPVQRLDRDPRVGPEIWAHLIRDAVVAPTPTTNHRAVPGLVAWLDHTFARLPGHRPQQSRRTPGALDPVVLVEGDGLVAHLLALRDQGVGWHEMMVLLPAWTGAGAVRDRLLAAGAPAVVTGDRDFARLPEIKACLALMRAVAEPEDQAAIVSTLSRLFGLPLAPQSTWSYLDHHERPDSPLGAALGCLSRLHARRGAPWVTLLDAALAETGAEAAWAAGPRGPEARANLSRLREVLDAAQTGARSSEHALARAIRRARRLSGAHAVRPAVRVTTLFAARGDEARVVALTQMHRRPDASPVVVDWEAGAVVVQAGPLIPPDRPQLRKRALARQAAARRRWMYVAASRARDQLVIVRRPEDDLLAADVARGLPTHADHDAVVEVAPGVSVRVRHAEAMLEVATTEDVNVPPEPVFAAQRCPEPDALRRTPHPRLASEVLTLLDLDRRDLARDAELILDWLAAERGLDAACRRDTLACLLRLFAHPAWTARARAWAGVSTHGGPLDLCLTTGDGRWTVLAIDDAAPGTPEHGLRRHHLAERATAALATLGPCRSVNAVLISPE